MAIMEVPDSVAIHRNNEIVRRLKEGHLLREIGADYGLTRERVRQIAKSLGVTARMCRKAKCEQRIVELHAQGCSPSKIARALRLTTSGVCSFLTKRSIKPNPPRYAKSSTMKCALLIATNNGKRTLQEIADMCGLGLNHVSAMTGHVRDLGFEFIPKYPDWRNDKSR